MKRLIRRAALFAALCLPLGACASLDWSDLPEIAGRNDVISAASILASAICEMEGAAANVSETYGDESIKNLEVAAIFTLTATQTETAGGTVSAVVPVGVTNVTLSGKPKPQSTAKRVIVINQTFVTGGDRKCAEDDFTDRGLIEIAPGLGIEDALSQWAGLRVVTGGPREKFQYTVNFEVRNGTDLDISGKATNPDGNVYTLGFTPSLTRTIDHKLGLTMKPRPKEVAPAQDMSPERREKLLDDTRDLLLFVGED